MKRILPLTLLVVAALLVFGWKVHESDAGLPDEGLQNQRITRELLTDTESEALLAVAEAGLVQPLDTALFNGRVQAPGEPTVVTVVVRAASSQVPASAKFTVSFNGPTGPDSDEITEASLLGAPLVVPLLRPGRYSIRAAAQGCFCDTEWIEVDRGGALAPITLTAKAGMKISGHVETTDHHPVGGATIFVTEGFGATIGTSAVSKNDGGFEVFVPQANSSIRNELLVLAEGFQPFRKRENIRFNELKLVLEKGMEINGRVETNAESPISGARISWRLQGRQAARIVQWLTEHSAVSDVNGNFTLRGVQPGPLSLTAKASAYAPETMRVRADNLEDDVVFQLEAGRALHGRVVDDEGEPVESARIEINDAEMARSRPLEFASTDENGEFELESLAQGRFLVAVEASGFAPLAEYVTLPAENELALTLVEAARLTGSIQGAAGQKYEIALLGQGTPVLRFRESFSTPSFSMGNLAAGVYKVMLSVDGRPDETAGEVTLVGGQEAPFIYALSTSGGEIAGEVVVSGNADPASARLTLFRTVDPSTGNRETVATRQTQSNGSFRFGGLTPGEYSLLVSPDQGTSQLFAQLWIEQDTSLDVGTVEVSAGASLRVLVLDKQGRPLPSKSISIGDGQTQFVRRTDDRGMAVIENLKPGTCSVSMGVDGVPLSVEGESWAGQLTELVLDTRNQQLQSWHGRIQNADGSPLGTVGLRALASDLSWTSNSVESEADGSFELRGALTGGFILEVYMLPGAAPMRELLIEANGASSYPDLVVLPTGRIDGLMPEGSVHVAVSYRTWVEGSFGDLAARRGLNYANTTAAAGDPFEIPYLPNGSYEIQFQDAAKETLTRRTAVIQSGTTTFD